MPPLKPPTPLSPCRPPPQSLRADQLHSREESESQELEEHHRRYLSLTYPVTLRHVPFNFNPASAWSVGVQMAALIFRGGGAGATLAHAGRFAQDNGGCGYILKPPHLRMDAHTDDQDDENMGPSSMSLNLKLRILAARATIPSIRGSQVSVAVSVWGASSDCARQTYRTVPGPCPWCPGAPGGHVVKWEEANAGSMIFNVKSPSTAVLAFEVFETDMNRGTPEAIGNYAAPLSCVRDGIRWVSLWKPGSMSASLTQYGALCGLLVHVVQTRAVANS